MFRKNLIVLGFRLLFTPPLFPVDIRGAARPGQNSLPLGDHTEFGNLRFPAPECLLMVQVCLALGQNAGGPCCNDLTYQRFSFPAGQRGVSVNTISVRGDHVWLGGAGDVQLFTH